MRIIKFPNLKGKLMKEEPVNSSCDVNMSKNEKLSLEAISCMKSNRDLCDRLFESLIIDLRILIKQYYNNCLDDRSLVDEIENIQKAMKALCVNGDIRKILERANLIMLSKLTENIK